MARRSLSPSYSRDVDSLAHRRPYAEDHLPETAISTTDPVAHQADTSRHQWADLVEDIRRADVLGHPQEDSITVIKAGEAAEEVGAASAAVEMILVVTDLGAPCLARDLDRLDEARHTLDLVPGAHRDVGVAAVIEGVTRLVEVEAQVGAAGGVPATVPTVATVGVEAGAGVGDVVHREDRASVWNLWNDSRGQADEKMLGATTPPEHLQ